VALTKFNFNSFDLTTAASTGLAFNSSANGFQTSTSGSMTLIKTLTASSSATLSFVDGSSDVVLDNTYPVYLFKFINLHPASSNSNMSFNGSTDSGSNYNVTKTTSTIQCYHTENDSAASVFYNTNFDIAQGTGFQALNYGDGDTSNDASFCGSLFLFNPSSTTFIKHFLADTHQMASDPSAERNLTAGYFNTTSAIDAIQFKSDSGNIDAGTIKLYGIKDS